MTQRDRDHGKSGLRRVVAASGMLPALRRKGPARHLASIAAALARQGINLDAVLQEPGYPKDALPFVITVEPARNPRSRPQPKEIGGADYHAEPPLALPMLLGDDQRRDMFLSSCHLTTFIRSRGAGSTL